MIDDGRIWGYYPVFDSSKIIRTGIPLIYKELRFFLFLENVVWNCYPDIFLNFLFRSFGW